MIQQGFHGRRASDQVHYVYDRRSRPIVNTVTKTITPENVRAVSAANIRHQMALHPNLGSQNRLAKATGIPQRTIGRIVNEEQTVGLELLTRIADAFGLAPHHLLLPTGAAEKT